MTDSLEQPLPDDVRNVPSTASDRTGAPLLPIHDAARALVDNWYTHSEAKASSAERRVLVGLILAFVQQAVAQEREACIAEANQRGHLRFVGGSTGNAWDTQAAIVAALRARTP